MNKQEDQRLFPARTNMLLKGIEEDEENAGMVTRATWLRATAGHHTRLANKLIHDAWCMTTKTGDVQRAAEIKY